MFVRIKELDGIRGIAILLVIVWHYVSCQIPPAPYSHPALAELKSLTRLTWGGVDLFFVLSGFLIAGILIDNKSSSNYFKVFYLRRICRIFPLYYLIITSFIFILTLRPAGLEWLYENPLSIAYYLTFTQNFAMGVNNHFGYNGIAATWSLAIEEQFYLFIPFFIKNLKYRNIIILFLSLLLLAPVIRHIRNLGYGVFFYPFARADALMIGALLAICIRDSAIITFLRCNHSSIIIIILIFLVGFGVLTFWDNSMGQPFNHLWISLLSGLIILIPITNNRSIASKILRSPLLVWFGLRSYGIYLFHQLISGILHGLIFHSEPIIKNYETAAVTCLSLIFTCFLSEISFRWIERPIVSYGHRYTYKKDMPAISKAAFSKYN